MPVIVRDAVASDHLVYAWPFPIGPEDYEVSCADDEQVVMCPAWVVGGLLGPGRHRWRTPDPTRPVAAFFVLTAPVEVAFDLATSFAMPNTGQPVRLHANGSLQVRCVDPGLLIAQFVGLPFDGVNEGILRSVSRSVERMLARLLTRRVVMAGTPAAVTDPAMLPHIIEELIAYNPAAGAVFGIELMRMGRLVINADDGNQPLHSLSSNLEWSGPHRPGSNTETDRAPPASHLLETMRTKPPSVPPPRAQPRGDHTPTPPMPIPAAVPRRTEGGLPTTASGEIHVRAESKPGITVTARGIPTTPLPGSTPTPPSVAVPPLPSAASTAGPSAIVSSTSSSVSGTISGAIPSIPPIPSIPSGGAASAAPAPIPRRAGSIDVPGPTEDITQPAMQPTRVPPPPVTAVGSQPGTRLEPDDEPRGSIMGIGMSPIGSTPSPSGATKSAIKSSANSATSGSSTVASGEIPMKIAPGARVLVAGPSGLMQSATVRQLVQGYYELEVGGSGETIWVPINGVVPE